MRPRAFEPGRVYSEPEVNERLFSVYDDYTALRRYLVEERCLTRDRAGSQYRLAERARGQPCRSCAGSTTCRMMTNNPAINGMNNRAPMTPSNV